MNWSFFPEIYVLNQPERPDRWELCEQELARVGIVDYERFYSLAGDPPMKSFCLSQHAMISKGGEGLYLEDDVTFTDLWALQDAVYQLPTDWDVLYLGCNLRGQSPEYYDHNLRRVKRSVWMSQSNAYSQKMAEYIAKEYQPETGQMFDDWLGQQIESPLLGIKAFLVAPMVTGQRPGKSDLWGCHVDYTETINQGNELL